MGPVSVGPNVLLGPAVSRQLWGILIANDVEKRGVVANVTHDSQQLVTYGLTQWKHFQAETNITVHTHEPN